MLKALALFLTPLLLAAAGGPQLANTAMQGDRDAVRALLKQHIDVNAPQGDGMTALHWAAYQSDADMARMLIQAGANVKATTRLESLTPLDLAARNGDAAMLEFLLKSGADPNQVNGNGTTPLMLAAASGGADAVKVLLDHGADVNAKESAHGQTALMFAAAKNRAAVIKVLMTRGANASATSNLTKLETRQLRFDPDGNIIPDDAPAPAVVPPPPGARPSEEKTPAAQNKAAEGIKAPAETVTGNGRGGGRGGPPRSFGATSMGGMTALLYAARDGEIDAARALVESGANINETNGSEKITPLVMAIANGHYDLAKYLLDHGADPNVATTQGLTPLYATVDVQWSPHAWYPEPVVAREQVSYLDLMKDLLSKGANPNARIEKKAWFRTTSHDATWVDPAGATAFWRAAQASDLEAMQLLLSSGADPKIASADGDTPLMVAAGLGWGWNFSVQSPASWIGTVRFLLPLGYNLNSADGKGYTALHGAAYVGDNELVKLLVDKGADVHAVAKDKNTVADMANGPNRFGIPHPETVALLETLGSANSHNCRSDQCLVAPMPDRPGGRGGRGGAPPAETPAPKPATPPPAPK